MIKKQYKSLVARYDRIMDTIGCEHLMVGDGTSECMQERDAYGLSDGVTIGWMRGQVSYWLSCYYEEGHCRYEERREGPAEYKTWVRETGLLKRLCKKLDQYPMSEIVEEKWK